MADQPTSPTVQALKTPAERLEEIVALCRRYSHPGVNAGAHALAHKVLELAGEREDGK